MSPNVFACHRMPSNVTECHRFIYAKTGVWRTLYCTDEIEAEAGTDTDVAQTRVTQVDALAQPTGYRSGTAHWDQTVWDAVGLPATAINPLAGKFRQVFDLAGQLTASLDFSRCPN